VTAVSDPITLPRDQDMHGSTPMTNALSLPEFAATARAWLQAHAEPRPTVSQLSWGQGSDRVAVFRDSTPEEERAQVEAARAWQQAKFDAGYGAIAWPVEYGGAGLTIEHEQAFRLLEAEYLTPPVVEAVSISVGLEAPTILNLGTEEQKQRWVRSLRSARELCCQLFSEPGAGSDLGAISLRAERDGDSWVLNGQKVWSSGAQFADLGYVACRTDPTAPRTSAFTTFLVPMNTPGIEVRPIRQMTGGANFNEVFFVDVRVSDAARLGQVGAGWASMMTTLGFERATAAEGLGFSGPELLNRLVLTARHAGRSDDPLIRQRVADLYIRNRLRNWTAERAEARLKAGGVPGPEGSVAKLAYTRELQQTADLAGMLVGLAMVADTGEWGTYAWAAFVSGIPGLRFGGGTDEIQKNTIAERILGLPREPRLTATSERQQP
jgi:alkylation response protein AidB-like acyl-CoA dehydrogenase